MDISQQFLIDMALNIGGYLLAALLGIVIYSLFNRRKKVAAVACDEPTTANGDTPAASVETEVVPRKIEFIKLSEESDPTPNASGHARRPTAGDVSRRRDRADVIRVARTMLKAGAPHDKIKRVIPISDAELSLLSMSKS
ncbi:MAG: hypothetical protein JSV52_11900 [Candidatus Zixiibacteriota bacterium]|nr:MAG: hypothetical protein JSV52_11900 [candidate division Zixibacteria bacterium]